MEASVNKSVLEPGKRAARCDDDGYLEIKVISNITSTSAVTQVASSATVVTLLAANASRKDAIFYNDSTATLCLKLGSDAALDSFTVKIPPGGERSLADTIYTGVITGIWDAANGYCYVTELS